MKTLQQFAAKHGLILKAIRYKHQFGYCKRKGFDICGSDGRILASFEPCEYSNGDKWYLRNVHSNYSGKRYLARITTKFLEDNINVNETSFIYNSSVLA